jgi:serine kinase of HPr protein (carbohydrate metabolism regulator)
LIELRGNGIFRLATMSEVPVNLCVELVSPDGRERLPERRTTALGGCDVPVLRVPPGRTEPVAGILIALLGRRRD